MHRELLRRDLQDFHVGEQRDGIVTEIHQDIAHFVAPLRFGMHREPPLSDERGVGRNVRRLIALHPLDRKAVKFLRGRVAAYHDVGDNLDAQAIDFRHSPAERLGLRRPPASYQGAGKRRDKTRTPRTH
jgi:hypothetical protein